MSLKAFQIRMNKYISPIQRVENVNSDVELPEQEHSSELSSAMKIPDCIEAITADNEFVSVECSVNLNAP